MKFSELIEHSVDCLKTFNPVYKTIDTHADDFLKDVFIHSQILISRFSIKILMKKCSLSRYSMAV